ncbi:MAG: hypothetical protein WHS63_12025, partial [Tenuifilum sp.]|uniref:hypothetical protein n=1 Tax=Tenuifilum sp. TaxID=2760880 RepID=UPI0030B7F0E6
NVWCMVTARIANPRERGLQFVTDYKSAPAMRNEGWTKKNCTCLNQGNFLLNLLKATEQSGVCRTRLKTSGGEGNKV